MQNFSPKQISQSIFYPASGNCKRRNKGNFTRFSCLKTEIIKNHFQMTNKTGSRVLCYNKKFAITLQFLQVNLKAHLEYIDSE